MANNEYLRLIKEGPIVWNNWRKANPDAKLDLSDIHLGDIKLPKIDLSCATLDRIKLRWAYLREAKLSKSSLVKADLRIIDLSKADLSGANLAGADLGGAYLRDADFSGANLSNTNLAGANLNRANLRGAILQDANLKNAVLVDVDLTQATLNGCKIYGASVWNVNTKDSNQESLVITPANEPEITVDNLKVAQFIFLILKNQDIREVIDTITSKVVLILGRFTDERKKVLDAIRNELRKQNFTPVLFDFDKPASKDLTGTVETLARMARFIIADLTDPSSIPHELATIIPSLRTTPVLPIKLEGTTGYTMFKDFQDDLPHRVLKTYEYKDSQSLIATLPELIVPVNQKAEAFRNRRLD